MEVHLRLLNELSTTEKNCLALQQLKIYNQWWLQKLQVTDIFCQ